MTNTVSKEHIQGMLESLTFSYALVNDTTIACWAFLPNKWQVAYGESICADPDGFKEATGKKYAREDCIRTAITELCKLEGYLLKITGKVSDLARV